MTSLTGKLSWKVFKNSPWSMAIPVLMLGLFSFFFGERVPAGGGLGWDGVKYAEIVRELPILIESGQLNNYYAHRIVPPIIVRIFLWLSGQPYNNDLYIIKAFEIYNLVVLLMSCWSWHNIASTTALSTRGRWLGFAGIFVTYGCSKQSFYYPVLTDATATLVSLSLLRFYLQKRQIALLITTLIGAFVWPVVAVSGAPLILFINTRFSTASREGDKPAEVSADHHGKSKHYIVLSLGAVLLVSIASYLALTKGNIDISTSCHVPDIVSQLFGPGIVRCTWEAWLTGLPALIAIIFGLTLLIGSLSIIMETIHALRHVRRHYVALAIAALVVPYIIARAISNPELENPSSLRYLLEYMLLPPTGKFMLPFVTVAVFWGPVILLMTLYWEEVCTELRRLGPGAMAVVVLSLPLALANEPRFITIGWPFLVLATVMALERAQLRNGFLWAFGVLSILFAQFWMPLNLAPWTPPDYAGLFDFPKQFYFMHYGLWMNWLTYGIQFFVLILSALWLRSQVIAFQRH